MSKKKFECIEELQKARRKWVEANQENDFEEGIKNLLTELYPDNAHFIYELLQNAEDARNKDKLGSHGASQVCFTLNETNLEFKHNGEGLFTLDNVVGITGIGSNPTKRNDPTAIGKFGVGFKAVFAYTDTPEIQSGDFQFRIHDLVIPETDGFSPFSMNEQETRFIFPFNNPKKLPEIAVDEIETGLSKLGDNTLLFLSHIRKIEYTLPSGDVGSLQRINHKGGRIEIHANHPDGEKTVSHWLHFHKDVKVIDDDGKPKTCRIAIAYQLEQETGKSKDQSAWRIVSVGDGGQVSIYFPAEKETSKLRFHLHAPFASTVARDSVRDCEANKQLRDYLAELIVESLTTIREQGMLSMSFLAVLPNPRDSLAKFYEPIRQAIVNAFNNKLLTPTKNGSHAKADALYRGLVRITDVISDSDLSLLTNDETTLWAANPPQRNQREDNFLDSLAIKKWEIEQLTTIFKPADQEKIESWLAKKDDEWLMGFYALLNEAKESHDKSQPRWEKTDWPGLSFPLIRVYSKQGVKHVIGSQAYFAPEDKSISPPADIDIVKLAVYAKGNASDDINQLAKIFLLNIGVQPFNAKVAIELRLRHYQSPPEQIDDNHYEDIKQFIAYWKKHQEEKKLFQEHGFMLGVSNNQTDWLKATELCLDSPLCETGLAELEEIHQKKAIWSGYSENLDEDELSAFVEFAKAIGVMYELEVIKLDVEEAKKNPNNPYKWDRWTHTGCAHDYSISELEKYLVAKKMSASQHVWNALINAPKNSDIALFKPNQQHIQQTVDSQLVYHLKNHAWIPNTSGEFSTPRAMIHEVLRSDFPFNDGNGLLTKIEFGKNARDNKHSVDWLKQHQDRIGLERQQELKRNEELKNSTAQELGFDSAYEAEEAARLTEELGGIDKLRAMVARRKPTEQPNEPVEKEKLARRRENVLEKSLDAPDKESVQREGTIQIGLSDVKAQAKAYLRPKYKNDNHELICQCCREEMPFKLNEYHYFEAVQCVKNQEKRHYQNYLAFCPTCAAMYKHGRETDDAEILRLIVENDAPDDAPSVEIPVVLADKQHSLRFVGTHWFDLKTVFENS